MSKLTLPDGYKSALDMRRTEVAIKKVKDFFERDLAIALNLTRVSAPLFLRGGSGLNDNLNGIERAVAFDVPDVGGNAEIPQSLAKWKRYALGIYGFARGEGLYTDMNAIRRDEETDNMHSVYVDQWDWERVIAREERNTDTLRSIVRKIYASLLHTERYIAGEYEFVDTLLPEEIHFVTAQQLEDEFPTLSPKEREYQIVKRYGAVFVMGIGGKLKSGEIHDGRAPDYDDWSLNGDIIVYYPVLDIAFELSSMGIRVDETTLRSQLAERGCSERADLPFHRALLAGELPLTVGGGIGQSRMCMYFLRKAHIGEVQSSLWREEDIKQCHAAGITLL
jgi:aspartate--ammonia ligase, AsnA-type